MNKLFESKIYKICIGVIRTLLLILVLSYVSMILIQRLSGNKSIMGYRLFTVASGSMTGVYNLSDVIAVKDIDINALKVGDDVAYIGNRAGLEGKIITHRIINIEDGNNGEIIFTTKGVATKTEDPSIRGNQILGKVTGVVPIITTINHIVRSKTGFFFLVFCPLVITIVLDISEAITDYKLEKHCIQEKTN